MFHDPSSEGVIVSCLLQIYFPKYVLLLKDMYTICDTFDTLELNQISYIENLSCGNFFKCSKLKSRGAGVGLLHSIFWTWMKKYVIWSRKMWKMVLRTVYIHPSYFLVFGEGKEIMSFSLWTESSGSSLHVQKEIRAISSPQFLVILIAVGRSSLCS